MYISVYNYLAYLMRSSKPYTYMYLYEYPAEFIGVLHLGQRGDLQGRAGHLPGDLRVGALHLGADDGAGQEVTGCSTPDDSLLIRLEW